ncbi:DNA transposition protein, AAA+ family ATPase [Antarctobacter heliothermus]|uniref:DNA transposition protein, AAA+ family ATPase n=1 Tax=Antarctobacter heliothermus TaxID=74033 RepID=A0A239EJM7_9RHOB|nr:DNA transposition protein, AAA+ family ATPase [Antarctobacter heliothermus]
MAETRALYNTLAPMRNVTAFLTLVRRLENRGHGLPGMGCFYGPSGLGKTTASVYVANEEQACVVQVKSVWTQKKLCQAILAELGVHPAKVIGDMVDQIAEVLAREGVPLLIDEADFLVKKGMIEIVRDIYESSFVPVILIGEELLPQKLRKWERVHGRILSWVAAEPADDDDFDLLRRIRCPEVEIDAPLLAKMRTASGGSARRIVENLELAREIAATRNLDRLTLEDWGRRDFFTGITPDARRISA